MRLILLFLIVFDLAVPPVKFLGSAPIALVIMLPCMLNKTLLRAFKSNLYLFRYPISILGIAILFSFFRTTFSVNTQITFVLSLCKTMIIVLSCLLFISIFGSKKLKADIVNIFFINSIICFIAGSNQVLLDFVYIFKPDGALLSWIPYRNAFLSGNGFFGISTAFALVFFMMLYMLVNFKQGLMFYLKFLTIIIAGVIAGRTAMIGLLVGFIYIILTRPRYLIHMFLVISCFVGLVFGLEALSGYANWIFELFSNASGTTHSTGILFSMYDKPISLQQLFWGDALYNDLSGAYYMTVDAGYLRHLYFGGFVVVLLAILFPFSLAYTSKDGIYALFIVLMCLVFHIKGGFIFHSRTGMPVLIFLVMIFRDRYLYLNRDRLSIGITNERSNEIS